MTHWLNTPKNTRTAILLLILIALVSSNTAFAKRSSRGASSSKRSARETGRKAKNTRETAKSERAGRGAKHLSRRERALEAARLRREREEAARRAEIARQQALARQRAADQALRDETAANIAKDEVIGEDKEVRRIAIEALGNHAGSVVVMEPKTGKVLSVVNQDWALRRGFKPCSTIKLVTGLAGLSEKVIDPTQTFSTTAANYAADLSDSLALSNNGFFQHVGGDVGFDRMVNYARQLGLGETTGINHANEFSGRVPAYKSGSAVNHMSSHGDDFEVTPIQLGVLVSAIGNGGSLLVPHLPRTPEESANFQKQVKRELTIPKDALQRMVPGMIGAVNYGTARLAYDPTETIAGKTGTCIGQGSWLGLFTSFAPVVNPQLAVVVVTRGSGERGKVAAGIAGRIYRALDPRYGRTLTPQQLANTPQMPKPNPRVMGESDEDEEGDSMGADTAQTNAGSATTTPATTKGIITTVTKPDTVKRVLMPIGKPAVKAPAVNKTPVLQESTPDDIKIINEADGTSTNGNKAQETQQSTDQRPRRASSQP
jgi:membrane peptidoglycan carboxypeptidase